MRIGLDIDNVISNFNEELLIEYINHDKQLRNTGIINDTPAYIRNGMFDWSEAEEKEFYKNNIERIAKNLKVLNGAKEYIDKLSADGHYICIISGRDNGEYHDPYKMTKEWLDNHFIKYDKIVLTNVYSHKEKAIQCLENNIDIMIDDSVGICRCCIENNIKTFLMDTPYNRSADIPRVNSWKEIYETISNI